MKSEIEVPKTLQSAVIFYSNPDRCLEILAAQRWPDGVAVCPHCQAKGCTFMKSVTRWQCKNKDCRKQFTIKTGTFMEDSPLKLSTWLVGMWLIANAKNGISSYEIHRALGITQKSAWFMLHRIRMAFSDHQATNLNGTIESDESYIGGEEKNKHEHKKLKAGRGTVGKAAVMGMIERGPSSRARVVTIDTASKKVLQGEITTHVAAGSAIFTDAWKGYSGLPAEFMHDFVDHSIEYVRGQVHTNNLENFFSLLKRTIKGTYVAVDPVHLQAYLDEQTFRYNERKDNDSGRFIKVLGAVHGKRLTYKQLTTPFWAFQWA